MTPKNKAFGVTAVTVMTFGDSQNVRRIREVFQNELQAGSAGDMYFSGEWVPGGVVSPSVRKGQEQLLVAEDSTELRTRIVMNPTLRVQFQTQGWRSDSGPRFLSDLCAECAAEDRLYARGRRRISESRRWERSVRTKLLVKPSRPAPRVRHETSSPESAFEILRRVARLVCFKTLRLSLRSGCSRIRSTGDRLRCLCQRGLQVLAASKLSVNSLCPRPGTRA